MLPFQVQILGCGSSTPTLRHNPSAQIVRAHNRLFLFDCGEGTQRELRRHSIAMSHLQHIFITHLHGDHWFGLPGLLSTLALLGCRNTIYIHAFSELEKMLAPILHFHLQEDGMRVEFVAISPKGGEVVYEDKEFTITTLALHHRVPCVAYVCREKMALPHIRRDMIDFLKIPHYAIKDIKEGAGWQTADGIFYPHERLVTPANRPRTYAYMTDTQPCPEHAEALRGIDLLYHEATFCNDKTARAEETGHTTTSQAASFAKQIQCKRLMIGHFSARYTDDTQFLKEAIEIFPQSVLANEGVTINV